MVDFGSLESQKENIEPLRSGRSASTLAKTFSISPVESAANNDAIKDNYEIELQSSAELDDPLDLWARYLSWTQEAYPTGQNASSGYVQLLERCSKTFLKSPHYANDPRYLKIWIEYARYSDDPREMFCFLARNNIGQDLATFYEEYAAFLEVRGRKGQADEIYQMGLLRGARPLNRLKRKYDEFSQRLATNPARSDEPTSPPIAPIRSALTTKFGGLSEAQQKQPTSLNQAKKLQVFSDEAEPLEPSNVGSGGWGSIGTLQTRKKENNVEIRRMAGEKLPQKGQSNAGINKLEIFKDDPTIQVKVPATVSKKSERVACNLEAVYAVEGQESSFEELKALAMGLLNYCSSTTQAEDPAPEMYISVMDSESPLKDSPARRPMKHQFASPTINTKAAMDDVLGLWNQPLRCEQSDQSSDSDSDEDEPDQTFPVSRDVAWPQNCTQNSDGPEYHSNRIEDDNTITHERSIGGITTVPIGGLEIEPKHQPEEVEPSVEHSIPDVLPVMPATPQQQAIPKRANGFDLMTPITEDTENLQISAYSKRYMATLPEADDDQADADSEAEDLPTAANDDLYSSPFVENPPPRPSVVDSALLPMALALSAKMKVRPSHQAVPVAAAPTKATKGPMIQELFCNPMELALRLAIFAGMFPQIHTYDGCKMQPEVCYGKKFDAIEKYIRALNKRGGEATQHLEVILDFTSRYAIKKKLGEGAFAPVFLIENISGHSGLHRSKLEAVKIEKPGSAWEFYIMRQIQRRLGISRASQSIAMAHEYYEFSDCSFLLLDYKDQGTILDLVNLVRSDAGGVDEILAIFLTIELLRTIEALHAKELLHGDLKPDNCLLRLDSVNDSVWSSTYQRNGDLEWQHKGISLIDFGRGIDMKHFRPDVQFIADWKTDEQDCIEMREARPWTYQIDYHGLACIIHSLLFGKYIEIVSSAGLGVGKKRYSLKNSFKRYWKHELWVPLFDVLLNPASHGQLPVTSSLKMCRERLEDYLEQHGSSGIGIKGIIRKVENDLAMARKK